MGYIKKLKNNELVGGTDKTTIYPVTSAEAVFEEVIEDGKSNFVSQKHLNNHVTGDRIDPETITDYNIAKGTLSEEKLNTELKTKIQQGVDSSWTPKGDYDVEVIYNANDLVYDNNTLSSYLSLKADNVGHSVEDTEWWMVVLNGSYIHQIEEDAEAEIDAALEDTRAATTLANNAAENANTVSEQAASDVEDAIDSLGQQISELVEDQGASATTLVTEPTDTDGIKPVQNYVIGRALKKVNDFITGDAKPLEVGTLYSVNDFVVTEDNKLLRMTKNIYELSLNEKIHIGELKAYSNAVYQAQKDVVDFSVTDVTNASVSNPVYSLGSPSRLSISIARGNCNIKVAFTNGTEIVGGTQTITPAAGYSSGTIALAVYNALSTLSETGWVFSINNDTVIAEHDGIEGFDNYTLQFSETSGITCNTVSETTESKTVIALTPVIGSGSINVIFEGVAHSISIESSDVAGNIAHSIASAFTDIPDWNFSYSGSIVNVTNTNAGNNSNAEFTISDGVLGIVYTLSKPWTGSSSISYYDGTNWYIETLGHYAESNVFNQEDTIDEEWLIENATIQDSLYKELVDDEFVLTKYALDVSKQEELKKVEYVIAKAISYIKNGGGSDDGGNKGASSLKGTLTSSVSETISCFGSSFGLTGTYTVSGKNWPGILDLFSDYSIQVLSVDGKNNINHLQYLRGGTKVPSAKAKYAILANSENMKQSGSSTSPIAVTYQAFINLAKALMSWGVTPFIGTSYRPYNGASRAEYFISSLLRDWCKENNTLFMDAAEYRSVVGIAYNFDKPGNSHLGTRQAPLVAYAYMDALRGLERPYQSLKTYTKRGEVEVSITNLDNLVFVDNYERASKFRPASTFYDYGLISAVLPATSENITNIKLSFNTTANVKVYVMSTVSGGTFPSLSEYARFHIDEPISNLPEIGDFYMYNNESFKIVLINTEDHEGAFCDIYCTKGSLVDPGDEIISGTLTRSTGNGDPTINFSTYGIASLAESYADLVYNDPIAHWVEVEPNSKGAYILTNLRTHMYIDKLHFLVENVDTGSFSVSNIMIDWEASHLKDNYQRTPVSDFTSNVWNTNTELITEPTFGEVGTTQTSWSCITTEEGTSTTSAAVSEETREWQLTKNKSKDADKVRGLPPGCLSMISVGTNKAISTTVASSKLPAGKAVLEIQARYWGDDITTGFVNNKETITVDTFDWAKVIIRLNTGTAMHEYKKPVGVSWRIIRIPLDFIGSSEALPIRIYSDRDGVQIAKVSLKYI